MASVLAISGCLPWQSDGVENVAAPRENPAVAKQKARQAATAAAASAKANELGQIPVLMYHRVVKDATGPDDLTPQQFRAELERLVAEDYVPITAREYVTGKIGIPAGKHPVVLTFDDSSPSQLALDGMGTPNPDTAVGIMLDVARRHPEFRPVGTFYVTRDLFGLSVPEEQVQILRWLQDHGFDIGNHTFDHLNLRGRDKKAVYNEIVAGHRLITNLISTAPASLALPYGNQPTTKEWAKRGSAEGVRYDYGGVFLAGYTPGPSPFAKEFDPLGIPRIRSHEKTGDCKRFCSVAWLDYFKANPDKRYTSDGNVATVAYPKFKEPFAAKAFSRYALAY
ncbi:polysaccharide deacetylase family protein [Microtetraspora sp. NBRC 13810]|uniref:polysaccharide deacetylase family protein n=1 Tax=Microtetraspora sp. NBRC 13810 TaxID=3030990 RepID=UPI00255666CC|nr:polysaccharide deacetylase family protein [Microtetraspora sp. NBRC 13810]